MKVFWLSASGIESHAVEELDVLVERPDHALTEVFQFHALAIRACRERSFMPKIHAMPSTCF